jgi:hypothetical protein
MSAATRAYGPGARRLRNLPETGYKVHGLEAYFAARADPVRFANQLPASYGRVSPPHIARRARQSSSARAGVAG